MEKFKPLRRGIRQDRMDARETSARFRDTVYKSESDGISAKRRGSGAASVTL
jgi:hypothetical protein